MSNEINLSELTTKQLTNLLWALKGTPQAQAVYRELSHRPPQLTLKPHDPDWEAKFTIQLTRHLKSAEPNYPS